MRKEPQKPTAQQLARMQVLAAENPGLMEYAHHAGSFAIEKLDVEEMKSTALRTMYQQTEMQLGQIYEQVELLAKQAQRIKERTDVSRRLYKAKMSFKPCPGNTYFLYRKPNNDEILSMISPKEWGPGHPNIFVAAVRLLADQTWIIENLKENQTTRKRKDSGEQQGVEQSGD